jgi:hypothetical protein
VTEAERDADSVSRVYARLSEKFKALWMFHQFLQGVHRTSLKGAPVPEVAFAPLYEQIKRIKETKGVEPEDATKAAMRRLDGELDGLHEALADDDRLIPPSTLRQFFERVKAGDEELLLSILKFYYYAGSLGPDEMDKVDFLLTRLGTRKEPGGEIVLKPAGELEKLSGALLGLTSRPPVAPSEVQAVVTLLDVLRRDLDACERFEDLTKRKTLENLRTLKHRLGDAFFSAEVMEAVLASNVAFKKKFQLLYKEEERRILEASRDVIAKERDLEKDTRFMSAEFREDLERFRKDKDDFEKASRRHGVRPRDVKRLKESLHRLLARLDPAAADELDIDSDTTSGRSGTGRGSASGVRRRKAAASGHTPVPRAVAGWRAESDRSTSDTARRLLAAVDLVRSGGGPSVTDSSARLENWEVRAALRVYRANHEPSSSEPLTAHERLYFNGAVLRSRMDEEAQKLRDLVQEVGESSASDATIAPAGRCLVRAREVDRIFREALAAAEDDRAEWKQLTRSRFRHLRAFAGLWLLYSSLGGE